MFSDDFAYMRAAIALAEEAAAAGEIPVGAVVVDRETGEILGRGRNRREQDHSPTAHAEILAIEEAAKKRGSWRLSGCNLYVTLEPCPMCSGAIINARIDRVIFGAYDEKAGAVVSVQQMFSLPYNHKPRVTAGLLEEPCAAVLQAFFAGLRGKL
ncbi:MAG: nucleoside deaminase [Oscillospiraceae bacterium]|nr:nucleoside deaminase [Oscillospiraceae bacterium]MBR3447406.1 nucleoside deaminase [Oscillospiraceae bacterium]